jgi:hypothetical protein
MSVVVPIANEDIQTAVKIIARIAVRTRQCIT